MLDTWKMLGDALAEDVSTDHYKGYTGRYQFDPEAAVFSGAVTGLRDVITFQGDTELEAQVEFRNSVDCYLAFCAEQGREPERPSVLDIQ